MTRARSRPRRSTSTRRAGATGIGALAVLLLVAWMMIGPELAAPHLPDPSASAPKTSTEPHAPGSPATSAPTGGSPTDDAAADPATALDQLETLEVKGRAPRTGYDRELFGWREDVDRNGCDTRNDVLRRDLTELELKPGTGGCVVLAGRLERSAYSGDQVAFDREEDNSLDIDHVVALSDAWQTGAAGWDPGTRRAFANDPRNLLAVEDSLNQAKGDGDAATWLPPDSSQRCDYVARQIAVKGDYGLWVKPAEKEAMERVLSTCEGFPAFTAGAAWPAPAA